MTGASQLERGVDSAAAWWRLALAVLLSTIGGVGMWSVVVILPAVEAEFGVARAGASLPYSLRSHRPRPNVLAWTWRAPILMLARATASLDGLQTRQVSS